MKINVTDSMGRLARPVKNRKPFTEVVKEKEEADPTLQPPLIKSHPGMKKVETKGNIGRQDNEIGFQANTFTQALIGIGGVAAVVFLFFIVVKNKTALSIWFSRRFHVHYREPLN